MRAAGGSAHSDREADTDEANVTGPPDSSGDRGPWGLPSWTDGPLGDVVLYAASAVLAAGLAAVTIYHGHRVWGLCSVAAYLGGAVATLALHRGRSASHHRRMLVAAGVFSVSALVPLVVLVTQRVHGVPWSAQPEVDVVERMARLLLDTGTPYAALDGLGRAVHFTDYAPYLPAMAIFGLPHAAVSGADGSGVAAAATDARLVFAAVAAALLLLALRLVTGDGKRVPVRAVQLVAVLPATTLTLATGGDDLPVLALLVLAIACCHLGRVVPAGVAGGVALAMKLTAAPVLLVLAVALACSPGRRRNKRAVVFAGTGLVVAAALVLPSLLVAPADLVEHVIRFPAGLTGVESPAASPLPGYLLAQTGDAGRMAALAALAVAAVALGGWVLRRPPRTAAEAAERAAAGLVVAMLLMPATRYGYLVYPLVLTGSAIALRSLAAESTRSFALRNELGECTGGGPGAPAPPAPKKRPNTKSF